MAMLTHILQKMVCALIHIEFFQDVQCPIYNIAQQNHSTIYSTPLLFLADIRAVHLNCANKLNSVCSELKW